MSRPFSRRCGSGAHGTKRLCGGARPNAVPPRRFSFCCMDAGADEDDSDRSRSRTTARSSPTPACAVRSNCPKAAIAGSRIAGSGGPCKRAYRARSTRCGHGSTVRQRPNTTASARFVLGFSQGMMTAAALLLDDPARLAGRDSPQRLDRCRYRNRNPESSRRCARVHGPRFVRRRDSAGTHRAVATVSARSQRCRP